MLDSNGNQSINLHYESIDWFQHECNNDLIWVNNLENESKESSI